MDKNFIVESKSFTFSVLGGVLTLRVEEEEKISGCGHLEFSKLRVACADVGSVVGFPRRARFC
jgi:hypothetical protein